MDFLDSVLASMFEMSQYALYLQSSPTCIGCLLMKNHGPELHHRILMRMKEEWQFVIAMESETSSASLLASWCPFTKHQVYRELHGALEASAYKVTDFVLELVRAWFPVISSSSLVEDIFASMADTVKRSSKRETASLAGLQAAAIRATMQKCQTENELPRVKSVQLESVDHEGLEVRGLRSSIWRPESAPNSSSAAIVYATSIVCTCMLSMPCMNSK